MINYLPSRALCEKLKKKIAQHYDCSLIPPTLTNDQCCWNFQVCPGPRMLEAGDSHAAARPHGKRGH